METTILHRVYDRGLYGKKLLQYIGVILVGGILGYIGRTEKKLPTTMVYWGSRGWIQNSSPGNQNRVYLRVGIKT